MKMQWLLLDLSNDDAIFTVDVVESDGNDL